MSKVENGGEEKLELVEIQEGLFAFKNLTRNPPEVREKLIKELEEQAKALQRK